MFANLSRHDYKTKNYSASMKFTGERLVTQVNEYYTYEHLHRYYVAMDFVQDKHVLDIASGEGYGVALMAKTAKRVVGVDVAKEAITHAQKAYQQENVEFIQGDIRSLDFPDNSFDVITCFETIEHIVEHDKAISELKRVLKPKGVLLISTPDGLSEHEHASRGRNPFHPVELSKKEFLGLLNAHFKKVSLLFQKTINASLILTDGDDNSQLQEYRGNFDNYKLVDPHTHTQYFIGICTDLASLPGTKNSMLTYQNTHKSLLEKVIFKLRNLLK